MAPFSPQTPFTLLRFHEFGNHFCVKFQSGGGHAIVRTPCKIDPGFHALHLSNIPDPIAQLNQVSELERQNLLE